MAGASPAMTSGELQRLQPGLDLGAARFEEGRQREFFAELSIGSSVAKPGPSVAISNRMPLGSRKYSERK